jgi:hypothetical protein
MRGTDLRLGYRALIAGKTFRYSEVTDFDVKLGWMVDQDGEYILG